MKKLLIFCLTMALAPLSVIAAQQPVEIHHRLVPQPGTDKQVALTLDACSGQYDSDLIDFLVQHRIPATLFVTKRWLDRNPAGLAVIKAHLDLFQVEDHGEKHIPAVIGAGKSVYGIPGEPDVSHLKREILEGARAIEQATGIAPRWYRDATAEYDSRSIEEIGKLGYKIAGFSVNADNGATSKKSTIEKRLARIKSGDIIIAHMNKPASDTAEGLMAGLTRLRQEGVVFVRLDQVELQEITQKGKRKPDGI